MIRKDLFSHFCGIKMACLPGQEADEVFGEGNVHKNDITAAGRIHPPKRDHNAD